MFFEQEGSLLKVKEFETYSVFPRLLESPECTLIRPSWSDLQYATHGCNRFYGHRNCDKNCPNNSGRGTSIEFDENERHLVLNFVVPLCVEICGNASGRILLRNPCANSFQFETVSIGRTRDISDVVGYLLVG